jgi:hypothetical protein
MDGYAARRVETVMQARSSIQHGGEGGSVTTAARTSASGRGRLGVYVLLGGWVGAMPIPWIPDALVGKVRGSLVHDLVARHGVSLSPEAREILASSTPPWVSRGLVSQAVRVLGVRLAAQALTRFGPAGLIWPARSGFGTFALGYLFDRYLTARRSEQAVRIDEAEALRVRRAIEGAAVRAFSKRPEPPEEPLAIDDQRGPATTVVDTVLSLAAGLPGRVLDHLDAAFDELVATADG